MPKVDVAQIQINNDLRDLQALADRLRQAGFSWQHEDYFLLKRCLPKMLAGMKTDYPVLKILEDYLRQGAVLTDFTSKDGSWWLFRANGEEIVSGENLQKLLENLIWRDC